tara:strand:+ start:7294 stop:7875 length:582 start_codon:yes stop_codon:yes gene_type:complete
MNEPEIIRYSDRYLEDLKRAKEISGINDPEIKTFADNIYNGEPFLLVSRESDVLEIAYFIPGDMADSIDGKDNQVHTHFYAETAANFRVENTATATKDGIEVFKPAVNVFYEGLGRPVKRIMGSIGVQSKWMNLNTGLRVRREYTPHAAYFGEELSIEILRALIYKKMSDFGKHTNELMDKLEDTAVMPSQSE